MSISVDDDSYTLDVANTASFVTPEGCALYDVFFQLIDNAKVYRNIGFRFFLSLL